MRSEGGTIRERAASIGVQRHQAAREHRFLDTFAVSLLLKGVNLSHVSILLGHASTKITERHYARWVKASQDPREADVPRIWAGRYAPA